MASLRPRPHRPSQQLMLLLLLRLLVICCAALLGTSNNEDRRLLLLMGIEGEGETRREEELPDSGSETDEEEM